MAGEVSKYAMESAYKDVERDALARTTAQENPKAILLGGQPGSGKSALAAEAIRELRANGGAVVIDADRMREENPRYKQLRAKTPSTPPTERRKRPANGLPASRWPPWRTAAIWWWTARCAARRTSGT